MKILENIISLLITITVFLVYIIIVDGSLMLGICVISLSISSGIYIPIIVGGTLIYMSFLNSEVLCQDLEHIVNGDLKYIIHGYDSFDNDKYKDSDIRKEIIESEEDNDENETLSEKVNILKREYIHYQSSNNDYLIWEIKEQSDTMMKIQDCINNLEKIANKQIVLQIEEVWEKIKMHILDNFIQCFVYNNYTNLNKGFESAVVRKLTEENKKLLENQELLLKNIIMSLTNKMLEKKERENEYLILELDAVKTAINSVINMY